MVSNMRILLFVLSSCLSIGVLLLADYSQRPSTPSFSYARRGLNLVAVAGKDSTKLQEATQVLREALQQDKDDPLALFGLGWALQLQGLPQDALPYYLQAITQLSQLKGFAEHNLSLLNSSSNSNSSSVSAAQ